MFLRVLCIWAAVVGASLAFTSRSLAAAGDRNANIFGVVGHFLHNDELYDQYSPYWRVEHTLPVVRDLGARWVVEGLYPLTNAKGALVPGPTPDMRQYLTVAKNRSTVEGWLAKYDKARLEIVLTMLAYPPAARGAEQINQQFTAWVTELVLHHPSIVAVQLHNEPNLAHFWQGTAEDYVRTYRPIAQAIKAARPSVQIVVGAIANLSWPPAVAWFQRALDAGVLDFADAVSVHPYNNTAPPEVDPFYAGAPATDPDNLERSLRDFWARVQQAAGPRRLKLHLSEFGYSTAPRGPGRLGAIGSEELQADYLSRLMLIYQDLRLRGLPIEAVFWYDLKDDGLDGDNEQYRYGLVSFDLRRRKPAFGTYQSIIRAFPRTADLEPLDIEPGLVSEAPARVKTLTWRRRSDGALIVAFWRLDEAGAQVDVQLTVPLPKGMRRVRTVARQTAGTAVELQRFSVADRMLQVTVPAGSRAAWLTIR